MFNSMFGAGDDPVSIFLGLSVGGLALFFTLATLNWVVFFVIARRRFHPGYRPNWRENRKAMGISIGSLLGNAVLTTPIHWAIATGHSQIYWDVSEHGWPWLLLSVALMITVTESAIYWVHRWLHTPLGWRLHRHHHQFKVNTPWVGVAFHPLDSFSQALPHHLCAFLFPVHGLVYLLSVTIVTFWAVSIHDRTTLVPWKAINYTAHHTLHHWYSDYNYGQYLTLWDRLAGTYRDPDTAYGDIPPEVMSPPYAWLRRKG